MIGLTYLLRVFLKHLLYNLLSCSGPENGEGSILSFIFSSLSAALLKKCKLYDIIYSHSCWSVKSDLIVQTRLTINQYYHHCSRQWHIYCMVKFMRSSDIYRGPSNNKWLSGKVISLHYIHYYYCVGQKITNSLILPGIGCWFINYSHFHYIWWNLWK